jgi:seryl-tRNA synthetase
MPSRAGRSQRRKGRVGVSECDEQVRRAREEVEELEAARVRLSGDVMRGDPKARNEDRQMERRIRDLTRWIMRAEQEEKDELRAGTERRGEELRQAWRDNHPSQEGREEGRPEKGGPAS